MPMKPWPDEVMRLAVDVDVDVVPMGELVGDDLRRTSGSLAVQVLDRLVGEDDAPAERHARRVALEHVDLVRGSRSFIEMAK